MNDALQSICDSDSACLSIVSMVLSSSINIVGKDVMRKMWVLLITSLAISACSAPTKEPITQPPVEKSLLDGIWQGSFDIRGRGPYDFHVIHVNGRSTAVSNKAKAICVGNVRLDGEYYTAKYQLYSLDGAPFDQATITGVLNDGAIDSHFVTLNGGDTGSLRISYNEIYEQKSSLHKVAGKWSFTDRDDLTIDVAIDEAGTIQGTDSDECKYAGQVKIINANYNAYEIALTIGNCGPVSGDYQGLSYLDSQEVDFFRIDITNKFYGFHYDLQKESHVEELQKI